MPMMQRLNPPRPHGRGHLSSYGRSNNEELKSTPPTRAGTRYTFYISQPIVLKSTPPTRAGTIADTQDGSLMLA